MLVNWQGYIDPLTPGDYPVRVDYMTTPSQACSNAPLTGGWGWTVQVVQETLPIVPRVDTDRDGLDDVDEPGTATNPDSNADGVIDSVSLKTGHGITPHNYDGDGLNGAAEIARGTSAFYADTDRDGVNDNIDTFPLDPTRSAVPATNSSDVTPPVVTIMSPRFATLL